MAKKDKIQIPSPKEYFEAEKEQPKKGMDIPSPDEYFSSKKKEGGESEASSEVYSNILSQSESKDTPDLSYLQPIETASSSSERVAPNFDDTADKMLQIEEYQSVVNQIQSQDKDELKEAKGRVKRQLEREAKHTPTKIEQGEEVPDLSKVDPEKKIIGGLTVPSGATYALNKAAASSVMFKGMAMSLAAIEAASTGEKTRTVHADIMNEIYQNMDDYNNPSLAADVAGVTLGFIADSPIFGGWGRAGKLSYQGLSKAAAFTEKKLLQSGLSRTVAKEATKQSLLRGGKQAAMTTGTALGGHTFMNSVADQYGDLSFEDIDYAESLKQAGWSYGTGMAIGYFGNVMGNLANNISSKSITKAITSGRFNLNTIKQAKAKGAAVNFGAYAGEVGIFEASHLLQHGTDDFTWRAAAENAVFIGLLKGHRTLTTRSKMNKAKEAGVLDVPLTKTELETVNFSSSEVMYKSLKEKPERIKPVMNNPSISLKAKQKILYGTYGAIVSNLPAPSKVEVDEKGMKVYSKNGELLDIASRSEAINSFGTMVIHAQKAVDMYNALDRLSTKATAEEIKIIDSKLRDMGYDQGIESPIFKEVLVKREKLRPEDHKAIDNLTNLVKEKVAVKESEKPSDANIELLQDQRTTVKGGIKQKDGEVEISDPLLGRETLRSPNEADQIKVDTKQKIKDTKEEIKKRTNIPEDSQYRIGGKTFKSKEKFIEGLKEFMKDPNFDADIFTTPEFRHGDMKFSEVMGIVNKLSSQQSKGHETTLELTSIPELEARIRMYERRIERADEAAKLLAGEKKIETPKETTTTGEEAPQNAIIGETKAGIIPMDIPSKGQRTWDKWFKSRGVLPKGVFRLFLKMHGGVQGKLKEIEFTTRDFNDAAVKAYGRKMSGKPKMSTEEIKKLNQALTSLGEGAENSSVALQGIPKEMHSVLKKMRTDIDALSREMIRQGLVEGDLVAQFDANTGYYVTRAYKMFNEKKYGWDKIPDEVRNNAISFVRKQFPELTQEQAIWKLKSYLAEKESPLNMFVKGKLGSKNLDILKKRKDIPWEMRAFMGEYQDPLYNYANSVYKMTDMISKHQFLKGVKEFGKDYFLFDKEQGEFIKRIAVEKENSPMAPLDGLYTAPYLADAFATFGKSHALIGAAKQYMKFNAALKMGKTVFSVQTHARNYISNYMFHLANGRNPFGATKVTIDQLKADKKSPEWRNYVKSLIEKGVIDDNARAGELRDIVLDSYDSFANFQKASDNFASTMLKKGYKFTQNLYQAEDNVHKVFAYEYEKQRYKEAFTEHYKNKSKQETDRMADERAVETVRATMPVYSMVPEAIKQMRRFPLVGTFVSFPAEVIRNSYNTVDLAMREMRDPATREIGASRMVGVLGASTVTSSASLMSQYSTGVTKQDRQDLTPFLAPWEKYSELIFLSQENGKYTMLDLGYSDPYNYIKTSVNAYFKNAGKTDINPVVEAVKEFTEPFIGEEMLASVLIDLMRNTKKGTDRPIYNKQLLLGDQVKQGFEYAWGTLKPGILTSSDRVREAYQQMEKTGDKKPLAIEIGANIFGQRVSTRDVDDSFGYKVSDYKKGMTEARGDFLSIYYKNRKNPDEVDQEEYQKIYKRSNEAMKNNLLEIHDLYKRARRLGVDDYKLIDKMKKYGLSDTEIGMIIGGNYVDMNPYTAQFPPKKSN